jgi:hypothetical protein
MRLKEKEAVRIRLGKEKNVDVTLHFIVFILYNILQLYCY